MLIQRLLFEKALIVLLLRGSMILGENLFYHIVQKTLRDVRTGRWIHFKKQAFFESFLAGARGYLQNGEQRYESSCCSDLQEREAPA